MYFRLAVARWLAGWRARHRDRAIGPLYLNDARSVVARPSPFSCSTTRATEQRCLSRISGQARATAVYPLVAGTRETAGDAALEMIDLSPEPPYAYLVAIDSLSSLSLFLLSIAFSFSFLVRLLPPFTRSPFLRPAEIRDPLRCVRASILPEWLLLHRIFCIVDDRSREPWTSARTPGLILAVRLFDGVAGPGNRDSARETVTCRLNVTEDSRLFRLTRFFASERKTRSVGNGATSFARFRLDVLRRTRRREESTEIVAEFIPPLVERARRPMSLGGAEGGPTLN